jgi:hypothetical protein
MLETRMPIKRAQMRLRVSLPTRDDPELREALRTHIAAVEKEEFGDSYTLVRHRCSVLFVEKCVLTLG